MHFKYYNKKLEKLNLLWFIMIKFLTLRQVSINIIMNTLYKRLSMSLLAMLFVIMAVIVCNDVRNSNDPGKRLATFPKETAIVAIP